MSNQIFTFTQVNLKQPLLPKLRTSKSQRSKVTSYSTNPSFHATSGVWDDYLRQTYLPDTQRLSAGVKSIVDNLKQKVQTESARRKNRPVLVGHSIQKQGFVENVQEFLVKQAKIYNRLVHQTNEKQQRLELLTFNYEQMVKMYSGEDELKRKLKNAKTRCKKAYQQIYSLDQSSECYRHMILTRREALVFVKEPVNRTRDLIDRIQTHIETAKQSNTTYETRLSTQNGEIQQHNLHEEEQRASRRLMLQKACNDLENQLKVYYSIKYSLDEHKAHEVYQQRQDYIDIMNERVKMLEKVLHYVQEEEDVEDQLQNKIAKFKQLQQHIRVANIEEVIPYLEYLETKRSLLNQSMLNGQKRIDELNQQQHLLKQELQTVVYNTEEELNQTSQLRKVLDEKLQILHQKEVRDMKYEDFILRITNVVSKIAFQIGGQPVDVVPSTTPGHLKYIETSLSNILNVINSQNNSQMNLWHVIIQLVSNLHQFVSKFNLNIKITYEQIS